MKITISGQVFVNSTAEQGRQEVSIGRSTSSVEFTFQDRGEKTMLRIDRRELSKVLEILEQGLM